MIQVSKKSNVVGLGPTLNKVQIFAIIETQLANQPQSQKLKQRNVKHEFQLV